MKLTFDRDNPNLRHVLVKLSRTDNCIALRTYDRTHGGHGRFLIICDRFRAWLEALPEIKDEATRETIKSLHDGAFFDTDCGHILVARRAGKSIRFEVTWLSTCDGVEAHGFIQRFEVPAAQLRELLDEHTHIKLLYVENGEGARIFCNPYAAQTIRHIRGDKLKRHAFRKAMRDCFNWRGDTITLWRDGRDDFYFNSEGAWPVNGGLILHEGIAKTPNGTYPELYYSVHT